MGFTLGKSSSLFLGVTLKNKNTLGVDGAIKIKRVVNAGQTRLTN